MAEEQRPDGLDGLISDTTGFVLGFLRTWALQLFAPQRASRILLADADTGHDRFVSASSFVVIGAILVGLGVSAPPNFDDIPAWLAEAAEQAIKAIEFDEDTFYLLASALLQAGLVYATARAGSLLGPRSMRTDTTRVLAYALTATQLGFLVGMAVVPITSRGLGVNEDYVTWLVLAWVLLVAPVVALSSWVFETHRGRVRVFRLLGTPVLLATAYAAMSGSQSWLYDRFQQVQVGKVSLDARTKPTTHGAWYKLSLEGWLDAGEVQDLCAPVLCPEDPAARGARSGADPCIPARFSRAWMPPIWETRLELYVTRKEGLVGDAAERVPTPERDMLLCCADRRDACYSGFAWGMWSTAEDMRDQTAILGRDITQREARELVRDELEHLRAGMRLYAELQGTWPELADNPRSRTELNADMTGFSPDDPSWQAVLRHVELGPTRGTFWSTVGGQGPVLMAATDLDGDGTPALFMVTLDGEVERLTGDAVY